MRIIRIIAGMLVLTSPACGGLIEVWEGPAIESFKPKTIAVLPPIVGPYEGARAPSQSVLATALGKSGRYQMIVGQESVNMAFSTQEGSDLLAAYYSKLETTGQSDKDMAIKVGQLVQADAVLVPKVNNWEYGRAEGDNFGKVGLGLRLIDTSNGSVVWKGRHEKIETYMVFKPALKDIAEDLSHYIVKYLPK